MCYPTFLEDHKSFLKDHQGFLKAISERLPLRQEGYIAYKPTHNGLTRVVSIELKQPKGRVAQPAFYDAPSELIWLPYKALDHPAAAVTVRTQNGVQTLAAAALKKVNKHMRYVALNLCQSQGSNLDKNLLLKSLERAIEANMEPIGKRPDDPKGIALDEQGFFSLTAEAKAEERYYWFIPKVRDDLKGDLYVLLNLYELKQQELAVKAWSRHLSLSAPLRPLTSFLGTESDRKRGLTRQPKPLTDTTWQVLTDPTRDGADEQQAWVRKALATPDVALLEGPPGSGKTTVILELVRQLIAQGKRVLLTSATHVAIDNVLERLLAQKVEGLLAVRIASNPNAITHSQVRKELYADNIYQKFAADTRKHLENVPTPTKGQATLKALVQDPSSVDLQHFLLNQANLVAGTLVGLLQHPGLKHAQYDTAPFDYIIVDEASKVSLQGFLVPARFAQRWVLVGDNMQLAPYADTDELAVAYRDKLQLPEEQASKLAEALCSAWAYRKDEARCQTYLRQFKEELAGTPAEQQEADLICMARVLLPAVLELFQHGVSFLSTGEEFGFNTGVYDPGAEADTWEDEEASPDANLADGWYPRFQSLTYQHRMVDSLAALPRKHFYHGRNMHTAGSTQKVDGLLQLLGPDDTAPAAWVSYPYQKLGRANMVEAKAVVQTYERLQSQLGQVTRSVYIICFYELQRRLISKLLKAKGIEPKEVVHTVDSVQGKEADVVLLCFTQYSESSFYHVPNRLNVALTRAKSRLLLFGPQQEMVKGFNPALVELAKLPTLSF